MGEEEGEGGRGEARGARVGAGIGIRRGKGGEGGGEGRRWESGGLGREGRDDGKGSCEFSFLVSCAFFERSLRRLLSLHLAVFVLKLSKLRSITVFGRVKLEEKVEISCFFVSVVLFFPFQRVSTFN